MASILKVDTIQDQDGNNIINESANTITIGASGDTITIPSGATLANSGIVTGFQSTGIDDNATSTAITINSSENVGIGETSPDSKLEVKLSSPGNAIKISGTSNNAPYLAFENEEGGTAYVRGRIRNASSGVNGGLVFETGSSGSMSEAMRIDTSGNVGIGNTNPVYPLDVLSSTATNVAILRSSGSTPNNCLVLEKTQGTGDLGNWDALIINGNDNVSYESRIRFTFDSITDGSTISSQRTGAGETDLRFYTTNAETTSERMRIVDNGNVGIGTTAPATPLDIRSFNGTRTTGGVSYNLGARIRPNDEGGLDIGSTSTDILLASMVDNGDMVFGTRFASTNLERMRILGNGAVHIGTQNTAGEAFRYYTSYTDGNVARFHNDTATNPYGMAIDFNNASPDDNTRYYLLCTDNTANRLRIHSDGDVVNHDNSYGAISDERIKQDIRDSNSQWNDIKAVRVRNFKKKDDVRQYGEDAWEQIGVIAQELETVSPKLIKHSDPTPSDILSDSSFGTLYQEGDEIPEGKNVGDVKEVHDQVKKVSYSVLYMKSIKALQEAMERIETLEAKVQTLENNQP